jgi:MFS family permease
MSTRAAIAGTVSSRSAPKRWAVFAILFALMVVDYLDRQVVVSMFPHLKAQWNLSDSELDLVSIVSIVVAIGAVPLSLLADRWGRVKSIFVMVLVWSAATLACAFARDYGSLAAARGMVGLGEAAYGTAGAALLATLFPPRMRSTVLGAFLAAAILGSVSGVMLGGFIAQRWGWQAGFGAVAIPGFVLALVFIATVRDYETVALPREAKASTAGMTTRLVVRELLRPKTALVTCVGAGFNLLVVSTMYAWLPSFFNRYYGLAPDVAGVQTAIVVMLGGVGALACSMIADRLSRRMPTARLMVPAFAALLTTAFMCVGFGILSPGPAQFALILAGAVVMAGSVGPTDAVVIDVSHPSLRATAVSVLSLTRNLFGLGGGPLLAGALSDRFGLQFAMAVVPVFGLIAAALSSARRARTPADLERRAAHESTAPQVHRQLESRLGILRAIRSGLDRQGGGASDDSGDLRRAGPEDHRAHPPRARRLMHAALRPRRAPAHPPRARVGRHARTDHRSAPARERAGDALDVHGSPDPRRATRKPSSARRARPEDTLQGQEMNFLDGSLFPENQMTSSSPRLTGPSG